MLKNTLIRTSGELENLPDGELSLAQMYKAIDCDVVEHVSLLNGDIEASLWCDENGLSEGCKFNPKATALYRDAYRGRLMFPADLAELRIVGHAIHSYHVCDTCGDPRHVTSEHDQAELISQHNND